MSTVTAPVVPLGCAVNGCGQTRRNHTNDDHTYQVPGWGAVTDRANARKQCGHWDGTRTCGSTHRVRAYIQGPRCTTHDPNNQAGAA